MNKKVLNEIFARYIERFEYTNGKDHAEYYKWQVCYEYPKLMQKALATDENSFSLTTLITIICIKPYSPGGLQIVSSSMMTGAVVIA